MPNILNRLHACVGVAAAVIVAAAAGGPAFAQSDFRVTHTFQRHGADQIDVVGKVFNDARLHANNVALTVYAMDAAGKVLSRANVYVGTVSQQETAPFTVRLHGGAAVADVRVTVTTYRLSVFPQGP